MARLSLRSSREVDGLAATVRDSAKDPNILTTKRKISDSSGSHIVASKSVMRSPPALIEAPQLASPTPAKRRKVAAEGVARRTDDSGVKTLSHENRRKAPISKNAHEMSKHIARSAASKTARLKVK